MILVDTGPLVALFDPKDPDFGGCHAILKKSLNQPLYTTEAVLTEAFHLLEPGSKGAEGLMQFILEGYMTVTALEQTDTARAFELMDKYSDRLMDYADASIVAVAEKMKTLRVFTLDMGDFSTYRIKKGHRYYRPVIVGP
jgi:uncharacterized protein